jgi:hypothetical protein
MFKALNLIFNFLLVLAFPLSAQDNFRAFVPQFIPEEASFEVSIITSKNFPEADKLDIYFFPDITLVINEIELRTENGEYKVSTKSEYLKDHSEVSQKISIDLTDTSIFSPESVLEIIIHLKSQNVISNKLDFYSEFVNKDKVLGHLNSSDENLHTDRQNFYRLVINYFEKYNTAEDAAKFNQNSFLNVPLEYSLNGKLIAEFWFKVKNYNETFLEIIDWETNRVEYKFSVNDYHMLDLDSKLNDDLQLEPFFISSNCWYDFVIIFNKDDSKLTFLCSENELTELKTNNTFNFDNLLIHFKNNNSKGSFSIDQFRLVSATGSLGGIIKNKNYSSYNDDSSQVIRQINFSESELENLLGQKLISYEGISLVKSNAPIFPKAPAVDIKLLNNFFEVDWQGGDYNNADYYVLERAIGNSGFKEVNKISADNSEEKVYSQLSEKPLHSEIVYFRIKQVNKDGSVVYSDVVKVGQGEVEDLILDQNYPNPFNPITTIKFELLQDSDVEVKVFNLEGKEVALLYNGYLNRGIHQFEFDAKNLPSGIFIYQVKTPLSIKSQKMIFAK